MASQTDSSSPASSGTAFPWILEHLLAYPGTYEIPLRTMYTLNCASLNQQPPSPPPTHVPGNAFPRTNKVVEEQQHMSTATAAAQLRANLMTHISQLSSQPASLPPIFISNFVRKCFAPELNDVDFPQALTAMDYLKDLEARRRAEILAAINKLGIKTNELQNNDVIAKKYPGVRKWADSIGEKEKKVEALYSQLYVGLRRWTLINEMSLTPFNKANCIAMLNTLYPPMGMTSSQAAQPTAQLTTSILSEQRNGFFRYITAVEKRGTGVLSSLTQQHKREGDENGWPSLYEALDNYLRMVNNIIEECDEVMGKGSPIATSFSSMEYDEEHRRKIDSGISFGSGRTSNRSSAQSHATRPSTSSSMSTHSHRFSKEKQLPEKPLPLPVEEEQPSRTSTKAAGSTLEKIAREIRRMRSRSTVREESRARPATSHAVRDESVAEAEPTTPSQGKTLRLKRSLMKMRSSGALRERSSSVGRSSVRDGGLVAGDQVPEFDAEEMKLRRQAWEEAQQGK